MQVVRTELTAANNGSITASCVNGPIQGTLAITGNKSLVKSVDPGDNILVTITKQV